MFRKNMRRFQKRKSLIRINVGRFQTCRFPFRKSTWGFLSCRFAIWRMAVGDALGKSQSEGADGFRPSGVDRASAVRCVG